MTPITGTLNPGIIRTVTWLRASGFDTTDSGDGQTHNHPCDQPYPYVAMRGTEADARRLAALVRSQGIPLPPSVEVWGEDLNKPQGVSIQYTYDPGDDTGLIVIAGLDDTRLSQL